MMFRQSKNEAQKNGRAARVIFPGGAFGVDPQAPLLRGI